MVLLLASEILGGSLAADATSRNMVCRTLSAYRGIARDWRWVARDTSGSSTRARVDIGDADPDRRGDLFPREDIPWA